MITENKICAYGLKDYFTGEPGTINDRCLVDSSTSPLMVKICRAFIRSMMIPAAKPVNSSYHLKHEVERWAGTYISNGAFIMAALLEGIMQEPTGPLSPNTWVYARKKYRGPVERKSGKTERYCLNRPGGRGCRSTSRLSGSRGQGNATGPGGEITQDERITPESGTARGAREEVQ